MSRLFWKIFLWFWLAMTLVIAATAFVSVSTRGENDDKSQNVRAARWRLVANSSFAQWAQAQVAAWEQGAAPKKTAPDDIVSWLLDDENTPDFNFQESAQWWIFAPDEKQLAHENNGGASSPIWENQARQLAKKAAKTDLVVSSRLENPNANFVSSGNSNNDVATNSAATNDVSKPTFAGSIPGELLASKARTPLRRDVVFVARLPFSDALRAPSADVAARRAFPLAFFFLRGEPLTRALRLLTMLLTAGLFCFWLARTVTRPVTQLRNAANRLESGQWNARIDTNLIRRRDEMGDLARDFNAMAAQLENLMTAQKRLIGDVSHELRSPLARLNIALELARRAANIQMPSASASKGATSSTRYSTDQTPQSPLESPLFQTTISTGEPQTQTHAELQTRNALDRIEREAHRLEEMVAQLLTLSRLENGAPLEGGDDFDLAELVRAIADDVRFENSASHCQIEIVAIEIAPEETGARQNAPVEIASGEVGIEAKIEQNSSSPNLSQPLEIATEGANLPPVVASVARKSLETANSDRLAARAMSPTSSRAESSMRMHGSRLLLRSALENIVRNAIRFSPPEGTVAIELRCVARLSNTPQIAIRVLDCGPGVPETELTRLFQPFYRVESARDRQSGGVGLGLAIAERAVLSHGGTIRAFNRENGGLGIEISLPQHL